MTGLLGIWKLKTVVTAAIGGVFFIWYWKRTRYWLPRYVHVLAAFALFVGYACLEMAPEDAPFRQGAWAWLSTILMVVCFPAIVYLVFLIFGGQMTAYERTHPPVRCPLCGDADAVPSEPCPGCGQTSE